VACSSCSGRARSLQVQNGRVVIPARQLMYVAEGATRPEPGATDGTAADMTFNPAAAEYGGSNAKAMVDARSRVAAVGGRVRAVAV
jgi:hypothetical protein